MRRLSTLVTVLAVLLLGGAGAGAADAPLRADQRVTDRAGVLDDAQARQVAQAIERLRAETGTDLYVVSVGTFDGADGQEWADESARLSQLGADQVLFAVAVDDRVYGISYDERFRLSQSRTDAIADDAVEPRLAADDWSGAAVALADGLGSGSGGVPVGALLLGGAAVAGGGAYVLSRRRKARATGGTAPAGNRPGPPAAHDEFGDIGTADLAYRASSALIEVDDAVHTSEQELAAARGHFGDEAVAGFTAALAESRTDMLRAFEIRQLLDDDQPEDEPAQRSGYADIIRACRAADDRLDAQIEAFDRLRDLEATAPAFVAALGTRLDAVTARLPVAEADWAGLRRRYAGEALEPVAGNLDQARQLLDAAAAEVAEARTELPGAGPAVAVVSGRAAEDALTQAGTLLDGIARRAAELADAASRVAAARAEVEQDVAEARALPDQDLAPIVARAEAALAAADRAAGAPQPDPIAALRLLDAAGTALDQGIDRARAAQDRARRAAAALDQALLTARSAVAAADDFILTRRGAVAGPARTRLAEAQRHLRQASGGGDPVVALREARQADALGQEALRLAQADVSQWSAPPSAARSSSLGVDLGSLILGGILSGAVRGGGGYRGGGGFGGGGGLGGGGRSPGSFGGSSSRGRRGGGGRF